MTNPRLRALQRDGALTPEEATRHGMCLVVEWSAREWQLDRLRELLCMTYAEALAEWQEGVK